MLMYTNRLWMFCLFLALPACMEERPAVSAAPQAPASPVQVAPQDTPSSEPEESKPGESEPEEAVPGVPTDLSTTDKKKTIGERFDQLPAWGKALTIALPIATFVLSGGGAVYFMYKNRRSRYIEVH